MNEEYYAAVMSDLSSASSMIKSLFTSRISIEVMAACLNENELAQGQAIVKSSACDIAQDGSQFSLKLQIGEDDPVNFLEQLTNGQDYYTVGKGNYRTLPNGEKERSNGGAAGNLFFSREGSGIIENTERIMGDIFKTEILNAASGSAATAVVTDYVANAIQGGLT